jgi:hypothetical protein
MTEAITTEKPSAYLNLEEESYFPIDINGYLTFPELIKFFVTDKKDTLDQHLASEYLHFLSTIREVGLMISDNTLTEEIENLKQDFLDHQSDFSFLEKIRVKIAFKLLSIFDPESEIAVHEIDNLIEELPPEASKEVVEKMFVIAGLIGLSFGTSKLLQYSGFIAGTSYFAFGEAPEEFDKLLKPIATYLVATGSPGVSPIPGLSGINRLVLYSTLDKFLISLYQKNRGSTLSKDAFETHTLTKVILPFDIAGMILLPILEFFRVFNLKPISSNTLITLAGVNELNKLIVNKKAGSQDNTKT